jgi:hypothetical protein
MLTTGPPKPLYEVTVVLCTSVQDISEQDTKGEDRSRVMGRLRGKGSEWVHIDCRF